MGLVIEKMKVVCAWCGKLIRGCECAEETSHSICTDCFIANAPQQPESETVDTVWGQFDIGGEG